MGVVDVLGDLPQEQGRAGLVPVVALVAHLEGLGDHDLQVDLAVEFQGLLQHGIIHLPHPVQAVKHLLVAGAEAEHLAQALVHGAVGVNAEGLVHHVPHGHGVGDDAGHRAHRVVVMAGGEGDLPAGGQLLRLLQILGQALVDQAAHHSAPDRAAHVAGRRGEW